MSPPKKPSNRPKTRNEQNLESETVGIVHQDRYSSETSQMDTTRPPTLSSTAEDEILLEEVRSTQPVGQEIIILDESISSEKKVKTNDDFAMVPEFLRKEVQVSVIRRASPGASNESFVEEKNLPISKTIVVSQPAKDANMTREEALAYFNSLNVKVIPLDQEPGLIETACEIPKPSTPGKESPEKPQIEPISEISKRYSCHICSYKSDITINFRRHLLIKHGLVEDVKLVPKKKKPLKQKKKSSPIDDWEPQRAEQASDPDWEPETSQGLQKTQPSPDFHSNTPVRTQRMKSSSMNFNVSPESDGQLKISTRPQRHVKKKVAITHPLYTKEKKIVRKIDLHGQNESLEERRISQLNKYVENADKYDVRKKKKKTK